jgi:hypothetical protein
MGTENADLSAGNIGESLDKNGAHCLKFLDDMLIVYYFMQDIHGSTMFLQCESDRFDRSNDTGAETSRGSEYYLFLFFHQYNEVPQGLKKVAGGGRNYR